jgi:hypothetical protein
MEVMGMRTLLAALFGVLLVLVGYSFQAASVIAQVPSDWLPFTAGETVRLEVDLPGGVFNCKVTQVQNGFIGCARDDQQRRSEQWVNLRYVKVITPPRER